MAVEPLYTSTKNAFLLKIRLSTSQSEQTNAVIDLVMSQVRQSFYTRLGATRALEIAGFTPAENPTTENENLIATASDAEATWVTALLMQRLPTMFMEGQSEANKIWNEEPLTRDTTRDLRKLIDTLLSQVDVMLGQLEIPINEDTGKVKSANIGALTPFNILGNTPGRPITL